MTNKIDENGYLNLTMDEWKSIHKDFKMILDGERMTMVNNKLVVVRIIK